MSEKSQCCCTDGGCCCEGSDEKKKLIIDFLYLDLTVCDRCLGTESSLEEAFNEVSIVLRAADTEVILNKINVNTRQLAEKYKFISSPTIRINGKDIQMDVKQNNCDSCGELCGDKVDCRIWVYNGKEYTSPPKAMIIDALLKSVYGSSEYEDTVDEDYVIPENLARFYELTVKR